VNSGKSSPLAQDHKTRWRWFEVTGTMRTSSGVMRWHWKRPGGPSEMNEGQATASLYIAIGRQSSSLEFSLDLIAEASQFLQLR